MPTEQRDSQGFYRTLMLNPGASEEQIRLAYEMLCELPAGEVGRSRSEIERAYAVLIDRSSRAAYDRLEFGPSKSRGNPISLNDRRVLSACIALLVAILVLVWLPLYGSRFRSFSAGDVLIDLTGQSFGTIIQSDGMHPFPGGETAPAYLVEVSSTKELRWFPASDLQATCRRSR